MHGHVFMDKASELLVKRIKQLMTERGITQSELARLSGIPQPHISGYMTKRTAPGIGSAQALANGLGVSLSALLGDRAPEVSPPRKPTEEELLAFIIERARIDDERKAALLLLLTDDTDLYETLMAGIRPHLPPALNKHKLPKAR